MDLKREGREGGGGRGGVVEGEGRRGKRREMGERGVVSKPLMSM